MVDLTRAVPTRLTFYAARDLNAVWAPDGSRVVFASARGDNVISQLYQKVSNGAGAEEALFAGDSGEQIAALDWSFDRRYIVFTRSKLGVPRVHNLWALPLFGDRKPFPLLQSSFDQVHAQLSPDGRWLAYDTNESGMYQIIVQPFPETTGGKWQVTAAGGIEPRWRRDARELYYLGFDGKIMAVSVKGDRIFEAGQPAPLIETTITVNVTQPDDAYHYDVTADGQRFLVLSYYPAANSAPASITAVVNWTAALRKK